MCTGQLCLWHSGSLSKVRSRQGLHLLFECQQKETESKTLSLSGSYKLSPLALCRWVLKRVACPQVPLTIYCIDWLDVPDNSLQSAVVSRDLEPDTNCVKTFVTSPPCHTGAISRTKENLKHHSMKQPLHCALKEFPDRWSRSHKSRSMWRWNPQRTKEETHLFSCSHRASIAAGWWENQFSHARDTIWGKTSLRYPVLL